MPKTFIIGCCAGLLGIGISLLALIPINSIIEQLSGITGLTAQLPVVSSLVLIAISIVNYHPWWAAPQRRKRPKKTL